MFFAYYITATGMFTRDFNFVVLKRCKEITRSWLESKGGPMRYRYPIIDHLVYLISPNSSIIKFWATQSARSSNENLVLRSARHDATSTIGAKVYSMLLWAVIGWAWR